MKVLHIIGSLDQQSGGPLRAVLDLSAMAAALGLQSEIVGLGPIRIPDNPLPTELIHSLPSAAPFSYGYAPTLRQWCKDNLRRFDVVMLHGLWMYPNWAVSRECIDVNLPYIVFPHGMLDLWSVNGQGFLKRVKKSFYWHWREKKVVADSTAVFFTTKRELHNACRTFRLPESQRLIVSPYGTTPRTGRTQVRPSAVVDQGQNSKVALFLGRVHPKKRPDILIQAWRAAQVGPDWRLVIAGNGEPSYMAELNLLVRELKLEKVVQFVGSVAGADKQYLFQNASWFLLPSEQENFGIAVMEAAQAGCALAVSDQVYLADELPDGSEILPVQVDAWAKFMRERMQDDAWRDAQARRSTEALLRKFDHDRVAQDWKAVIEGVIETPSKLAVYG